MICVKCEGQCKNPKVSKNNLNFHFHKYAVTHDLGLKHRKIFVFNFKLAHLQPLTLSSIVVVVDDDDDDD